MNLPRLFITGSLALLTLGCDKSNSPDAIGDPLDGLSADPGCESWIDEEDGLEYLIEGATRYIVVDVEFENEDTTVSGTLQYLLFANQEWKDYGEDDCKVTWLASGNVTEPASCGACEYQLEMDFSLHLAETDCPEDFYEGLEQAQDAYDVARFPETDKATYYWSRTGNVFTDDAMANNARTWARTEGACAWFGDSRPAD
jgi:hypothetical protein